MTKIAVRLQGPSGKLQKGSKYYAGNLLVDTSRKELTQGGTFDLQNRTHMVQFCLFSVAFFFALFFYYAALMNREHEVAVHHPAIPAH